MTGRANIPRKADVLALLAERPCTAGEIGRAIGLKPNRMGELMSKYVQMKFVEIEPPMRRPMVFRIPGSNKRDPSAHSITRRPDGRMVLSW